ncbi:IS1096 element passenger TnpR family protein [Brumimicrobium oceani]|uniref:Plasmid pRiA4b Orf3-like domain-containing protein n=1 Tax=Brumimicrobium oceani TaxID=2100725 RepID=A0A2U2XHF8_9FLAO|nr:hypothetical protein [Brumimicrobium oceani]PWH87187.1 hypothetical protein DIT68_02690 [Brumimicrobium oceani]
MAGLKFRVLLDSVEDKEVFRDILINDDFNFEHFYNTILDAFGFSNDQMASFFMSDEDWNKGEEISLMDMSFGQIEEEESPVEMNSVLLKDRIKNNRQKFILVHDFLSMWIFLIELHEITDEEIEHPQLILEVGEIPQSIKDKGPKNLEDMKFETDRDPNADEFDDFNDFKDEFGNDQFDNIDDYDI